MAYCKMGGRNNDNYPVAASVYFYKLDAGDYSEVKKMVKIDGGAVFPTDISDPGINNPKKPQAFLNSELNLELIYSSPRIHE